MNLRMLAIGVLLSAMIGACQPSVSPRPPRGAVATAPSGKAAVDLPCLLNGNGLEGQVVLVQVGHVGCDLSGKGLDEMTQLCRGKKIASLAYLRVEGNPDKATRDKYFADKKPPFPVVIDADRAIALGLSAGASPTYLLIDKFAQVRYRGAWPGEPLAAWTAALAAETNPSPAAAMFGDSELNAPKLLAETKLPDLKGAAMPLSEQMGAKGLMLLFVDTSCPFSGAALKETPGVAKVLAGLKIPSLVINGDDDQKTVTDFYAKANPGAPVLYDTTAKTREAWNIQSVPTVVYVTADKKIAYHGTAEWKSLAAAIEKSQGLAAGSVKFTTEGTGLG